jgi:hypothetical protein
MNYSYLVKGYILNPQWKKGSLNEKTQTDKLPFGIYFSSAWPSIKTDLQYQHVSTFIKTEILYRSKIYPDLDDFSNYVFTIYDGVETDGQK